MSQETFDSSEITAIRNNLSEAMDSLRVFLDPGDDTCNVSPDVRRAANEYLSTWVLPQIEQADIIIENRTGRNADRREEKSNRRSARI